MGGPQAGERSRAVRGIGTPPSSLKFRAQAPAAPEWGHRTEWEGGRQSSVTDPETLGLR